MISLLLTFVSGVMHAQLVINPVIHSKTHPSLMLDSIELSKFDTKCFLTVVNQNTEGTAWFCADKFIYIVENDSGIKHQLMYAEGIPHCPEMHTFTEFGEKLQFTLRFAPLENKKAEIDIIENCNDNCFSLKGIVLDPDLNAELRQFEKGVALFNNEESVEALSVFTPLLNSKYKTENHYAYSLYIIPVIYEKMMEYEQAKNAYQVLKASKLLKKQYFLEKLHEIPFFRDLD